MARNAEKAMSMLSRWRQAQKDEITGGPQKRPFNAAEVKDVKEAEKWRGEIVREITRKIAIIQNPSLGEFKIRDLNDEINKQMREKRHWEYRIKELGGPDYLKIGNKMLDREGKEVTGVKNYRYFGAAKDLPGVRELFEPEAPKAARRTRAQLMKMVNADYYGYRDDDDDQIIPLEEIQEQKAIAAAVLEWEKAKEGGYLDADDDEIEDIYSKADMFLAPGEKMDEDEKDDKVGTEENGFVAHVAVPSQDDVEKYLIERQKQALLNRYVSEELQAKTDNSEKLQIND